MRLEKILIGTKNKAKLEELRFSLKELEYKGVEILDLNKFEIIEPEENGNSFYENALIKATYYSKITNYQQYAMTVV
jgi:XTP/dITP diphosphohydrolase